MSLISVEHVTFCELYFGKISYFVPIQQRIWQINFLPTIFVVSLHVVCRVPYDVENAVSINLFLLSYYRYLNVSNACLHACLFIGTSNG